MTNENVALLTPCLKAIYPIAFLSHICSHNYSDSVIALATTFFLCDLWVKNKSGL